MKSTASQRKNGRRTGNNVITFGHLQCDTKSRFDHIAIAAYFKAEGRCFAAGRELDDWLAAEAEFDQAENKYA